MTDKIRKILLVAYLVLIGLIMPIIAIHVCFFEHGCRHKRAEKLPPSVYKLSDGTTITLVRKGHGIAESLRAATKNYSKVRETVR